MSQTPVRLGIGYNVTVENNRSVGVGIHQNGRQLRVIQTKRRIRQCIVDGGVDISFCGTDAFAEGLIAQVVKAFEKLAEFLPALRRAQQGTVKRYRCRIGQ